jgi:hypothetical protein
MRTARYIFLALALLSVLYSANAQEAQKSPKPGFFVFSQNKVSDQNVAKMNVVMDSMAAPILNELVKEGKLLGWGQLMHAWGDEWNYNWYFVTENHRAFLTFWGEYIKRLNTQFPGWGEKISGLLTEHKDNMYSIRSMR